jgi:hypothetical protein
VGASEARLKLFRVETVEYSEGEKRSGWSTPGSAVQTGWSGLLLILQQPTCGGERVSECYHLYIFKISKYF